MDIFIKSFNRPYYLERCIRSITRFIEGEYKITILDDGTPPVYLNKIQKLFPDVTILKSGQYDEKVSALGDHVAGKSPFKKTAIPTRFWRDSIKGRSPVFLLLEEDAWLTDRVSLNEIETTMTGNKLVIVKIGWNGSIELVQGERRLLSQTTEEIIPALPPLSRSVQRALLLNSFKVRSILLRLGLVKPSFLLPYYSLYTVTSAFFDKKYWLWIWEHAGEEVNEGCQLYRAVQYAQRYDSKYGKTLRENVRTSFITASVNRLKAVHFDMVALHHQLNEAWLKGALDCLQQFPRDFNIDYLKSFLSEKYPECTGQKWDEWILEFKTLYKGVGCIVDY